MSSSFSLSRSPVPAFGFSSPEAAHVARGWIGGNPLVDFG